MHHQSHHITISITVVIIMSTFRDLRKRQMAVELARQPIKPVNAVQTWREQGDDGEGDNDDDNDDDIDDFVPKTGRLAPSNASSSCLVVIICSLLIVALQLLQTSIMSYRAGGTFSAGIPPDFKFSSEFMKTLIFGKLIF